MSLPGVTGSGLHVLVTFRSAAVLTIVVAVSVSLPGFGSLVVDVTVAVLEMIVPSATALSTVKTAVNTALPTGIEAIEQSIVPTISPLLGVVQVQPAGGVSDQKLVPAGTESCQSTLAA